MLRATARREDGEAEDDKAALRWLGLEAAEVEAMLRPVAEVARLRGAGALSPAEIDFNLRELEGARQAIDAATGRLLVLLLDRRLDRELGFESFDEYVRERVGFSLRKARALITLARGVGRDPALGRAYGEGRMSWVQAMALLPLVRHGGPAGPWIARAGKVTLRQLSGEADQAIERAAGAGAPIGAPPLPGAALEEAANGTVQMREHRPGRHIVEFRAPATVAAFWSLALDAWRRRGEASSQGLERMLEAVFGEWPVFEHDGWRCAVPGCSARRDLHEHHVVFRSRGGTNEQENRITICQPHDGQGDPRWPDGSDGPGA